MAGVEPNHLTTRKQAMGPPVCPRPHHSLLYSDWVFSTENTYLGPGWIAQLVRASLRYAKVAGSIPGQDTYKNQPMNA